jgi:hypothetical protein
VAEKKSLQLTPMGGDPLLGMVRLVSSAAKGAILE